MTKPERNENVLDGLMLLFLTSCAVYFALMALGVVSLPAFTLKHFRPIPIRYILGIVSVVEFILCAKAGFHLYRRIRDDWDDEDYEDSVADRSR